MRFLSVTETATGVNIGVLVLDGSGPLSVLASDAGDGSDEHPLLHPGQFYLRDAMVSLGYSVEPSSNWDTVEIG
jgi:hypothetical protein